MTSIQSLRRLGADSSGEKAGIELPRDDLRVEGLLDRDGNLVNQPEVAISRVDSGEWRITILDD